MQCEVAVNMEQLTCFTTVPANAGPRTLTATDALVPQPGCLSHFDNARERWGIFLTKKLGISLCAFAPFLWLLAL